MSAAERLGALVSVWQHGSIELGRLAAANGIAYQFLQPNQYDDGAKPMDADERRVAFREDHPYRPGAREGYPLLRDAGRHISSAGIAFYDLSRIFAGDRTLLFADDCCHLRPEGYERIADRIADVIGTVRPPR